MDAVSRLRQVYFLDKLPPEELQALADMMDLRPFVPGDKILNQGEPTTNFYIVDSGYVNLRFTERNGAEKPVGSKGPGEFFGVKMFTTQAASEYTFEAVGQAEMWVVERRDWEELLKKFPDILEHMPELSAEYDRLTQGLDWLAPGEIIDLNTHRHQWALLLMLRRPLLGLAVFTIAFLSSLRFGVVDTLPWVILVYAVAMVFLLGWSAWEAILWWNERYIVTNKRAVRIIRILFLSDRRDEIPIEKIQSQFVTRGGPISVLLNIADLRLTSAANESGGILFEQVGNVEEIQSVIEGERVHVIDRRGAAEREILRTQIANQIRHYVFQQPNPPEKPKAQPKPPTSRERLNFVWNSLFGTEMRDAKIVTWRKSRLVLLQQALWGVGLFFVAILLLAFVLIAGAGLPVSPIGAFSAVGVTMAFALGIMIWQWLDWRVDLYRLTETQIVDIESLPFGLRYSENKADLAKIQDVNTERPHFYNTLLDYGNVVARVAGNSEPFTFISIKRPRAVADEITERTVVLKMRETERNTRDQTRTIVDAIIAYHRLVMAERHHHQPTPPPSPRRAASDNPSSPASLSAGDNGGSLTEESEFPSEADL